MSDRFDRTQDQIEGTLDEAKGQGKQTWGEATGDEQVGNLKDKLPG